MSISVKNHMSFWREISNVVEIHPKKIWLLKENPLYSFLDSSHPSLPVHYWRNILKCFYVRFYQGPEVLCHLCNIARGYLHDYTKGCPFYWHSGLLPSFGPSHPLPPCQGLNLCPLLQNHLNPPEKQIQGVIRLLDEIITEVQGDPLTQIKVCYFKWL